MKAVSKLVILLSLGALAAAGAYASTGDQAYIETCRKDPGVPVPVTVVAPTVGSEFSGDKVELEFVVDQTGKPANMGVRSTSNHVLAELVMDAVKEWRFKPAERNGLPVATKVVLPVKVVEPSFDGSDYAANN